MWNFTSNGITENVNPAEASLECSDNDEVSSSSTTSREEKEGLECPICWESFNIVENVPYVLWCGHSLCKNCILGLQWAVVKFPTLPVQLPLFISCPWCNLLSLRIVYRGNLKFPRKNFFLLWMVERMNNGDHHRVKKSRSPAARQNHHQPLFSSHRRAHNNQQSSRLSSGSGSDRVNTTIPTTMDRLDYSSIIRKYMVLFVNMTAKFPLVVIFLVIVLYAIPASAAILALYMLITVLFALPSFLFLYFSYPSLNWLLREIFT